MNINFSMGISLTDPEAAIKNNFTESYEYNMETVIVMLVQNLVFLRQELAAMKVLYGIWKTRVAK